MQVRPAGDSGGRGRGELQIKANVRAGEVGLVDFDRENIHACHQIRRGHSGLIESRFVNAADGDGRERRVGDRPRRHVAAENFFAVEIHHCAVVPKQGEHQARVN